MSAPIDEARLAKIEEWARDRAALCCGCGGVARVVIPGTTRSLCAACAPNVPGAVLPLASSSATALDLVAEVRRLTAALDAARRDEHCRPVQVVAGVAVRGGRVLLIRSKRHGVATPGGKVRIGETHADALRRELREETGLEVVRVGRYLHTDVQPAFQCHLYAVEVSESEPVAGDDAEAAWWGDPAEILASNIPRDYPLVLDVIRSGIGTHDDAPWFAAALDAARREGAEGMREAALRCCSPDDDHFDGFHAPDVWEQIEREIRALPLDAPKGTT